MRLARIVLALAIFAWLVHQIGMEQILARLSQADLALVILAIGAMTLESLGKAAIWQQVLHGVLGGRPIGFGRLLRCYFTGSFFGSVVPSSASTDALRMVLSQRHFGGHVAAHAASIVSLNAVNWFAGSVVALVALCALALQGLLPRMLQPAIGLFAGIVVLLPLFYWLLKFHRRLVVLGLRRMPYRWLRLRHGLRRFLDSMLIFERAHVGMWLVLPLAALAMLMQPLTLLVTAQAVGVDAPFLPLMIITPLASLIGVLPLNFAGFGITQAAFVYVLTFFGVTASEALVISALVAVETMALNVIGGLTFLFGAARPVVQTEVAASPRSTP